MRALVRASGIAKPRVEPVTATLMTRRPAGALGHLRSAVVALATSPLVSVYRDAIGQVISRRAQPVSDEDMALLKKAIE